MRHSSASPFGSNRINRTIARPKANSRSDAMLSPNPLSAGIFIMESVAKRKTSLSPVMKIAPKMEPGMLPRPPIMTMAIYSTESPRVKGSVDMLFM